MARITKLQLQEIEEVLTQFGLNEKDREVYLALLGSGETTLTPLARQLSHPVTTVQSVVNRLADLGLVKVSTRKTRHVYEAHDPVVLRRILERQIQEIADVIPLLQKMKTEPAAAGKIRVFYRDRATDIFHEALKCKSKTVYEIVAGRDIQDILGEKFHFTRRRVKNSVHLKSLRVQNREIKKYSKSKHARELREAKFLPAELTFRSNVMFWDDAVALFSVKDEGIAVLIESKSLRLMFEQVFDLLWSVSRKMETAQD